MKEKAKKLLADRSKTIPIISYPVSRLAGINIKDMVTLPEAQAKAMKFFADNYPAGAVFNMMDLSVEAEAFGSKVRIENDRIPEVDGTLISDIKEAEGLKIPPVSGRCRAFIDGVRSAVKQIGNIPVFCGAIGPFSLACRLFGMTELMMECFDNPESVAVLLEKCTKFITEYISALKNAGADGILLCEPAAGLLSPDMADEFSFPFVRKIFNDVSDSDFITGYHNCGASVSEMTDSLCSINADIYHFGNAADIAKLIPLLPESSIIAGNLDPLLFKLECGSVIESAIEKLYEECGKFSNFILSTGCDVPPDIIAANLDIYFSKARIFGKEQ
ncbi:MAG: uroporphyrinogen decarboxylase family protein [Clostridia bacterium]|nr:uroporphyrinogen decarboxylase family protein [Clostridia bacterium]